MSKEPAELAHVRKHLQAEAREYSGGKGWQAVARRVSEDGEPGKTAYAGGGSHAKKTDALAIAKVWIDAEVGRHMRLAMLGERRKDELAGVLNGNNERIDDLKERKADLTKQIGDLLGENAILVRECVSPRITINMYEGQKSYTYTVTERGSDQTVDDRQMSLFDAEATDEEPATATG